MAHPRTPLPTALSSGFSAPQARAARVGSRRLAQDDVVRVARGLYVRNAEMPPEMADEHPASRWRRTQLERALALGACLPPGLFFAHRTAAVLWGLPVPADFDSRLDVACFAPARAPRRPGLHASKVAHHLARVVEHRNAQVTDPASTWAMLAPRLEFRDGVALGDAVIHTPRFPGTTRLKRPPFALLEDLVSAARGPRSGAGRLRAMLPLLSEQSASAPETHLRLLIREWGLFEVALDHDVFDSAGRLLGCSELAFPRYRLALEYEGAHHFTQAQQWTRDLEKYHDYAEAGWEAFRVTSRMLYRKQSQLQRQLFSALRRRGWRG